MPKRTALAILLALCALIAACAPGARVIAPPTFTIDASSSGFVRIDPPGVGDGTATFRLAMQAHNPNPVALKLASLDGGLFVQDVRAATVSFRGGLELRANGSSPVTIDVRVPLGAAPSLLDSIGRLIAGQSVRYRVDASVGVELLGTVQSFPAFTLAQGELTRPLLLSAPTVTLAGGSVRFDSVTSVAIGLDLALANQGIVGYRLSSPELRLRVAGVDAATVGLGAVEVPAAGAATASLVFRFNPLALGPALATQVQAASAGSSGLGFELVGSFSLEAPGLASLALQSATLLSDVLR